MNTTATATRARAERRTIVAPIGPDNLRETDDGHLEVNGAYAAVFDAPSQGLRFVERIRPGAFSATLAADPDVRLLAQHDPSTVMARTAAGDLFLTEDAHGLAVRALLDPEDFDVQRLRTKVRNGHITGMSFAFWVMPDGEERVEVNGVTERHLTALDIDGGDVAFVTYPAYPDTDAGEIRGLEQLATGVDLRSGALAALPDDLDEPAVRTVLERLELRALELTLADKYERLYRAVQAVLGEETWDFYWYLRDVLDTTLVVRAVSYGDADPLPSGYWQHDYSIDDTGTVTLAGEWREVLPRTVYDAVPVTEVDDPSTDDTGDDQAAGDTSRTLSISEARTALLRRRR